MSRNSRNVVVMYSALAAGCCCNCLGAVGPAGCCSWDQHVPLTLCKFPQPESCSLVAPKKKKKDIELLRNFGESSLYNFISQRQSFSAYSVFEAGCFCSLFQTPAQLCGRINSLDLGVLFSKNTIFHPSNIIALFCLRHLCPSHPSVFFSGCLTLSIGVCLILVYVCEVYKLYCPI